MTNGRYRPNEYWYDHDNKPFKPFIHYNVGGNSKMHGAALFRFRESDFMEVKHYGGTSPAWPLQYNTLESCYTQAEFLYLVHGERHTNPTEPKKIYSYPFPPLPYEPVIADLSEKMVSIPERN